MQLCSLVRDDPLKKKMVTTPVFLPGEPHGQRACRATVQGITKSWAWLSDWTSSSSYEFEIFYKWIKWYICFLNTCFSYLFYLKELAEQLKAQLDKANKFQDTITQMSSKKSRVEVSNNSLIIGSQLPCVILLLCSGTI